MALTSPFEPAAAGLPFTTAAALPTTSLALTAITTQSGSTISVHALDTIVSTFAFLANALAITTAAEG